MRTKSKQTEPPSSHPYSLFISPQMPQRNSGQWLLWSADNTLSLHLSTVTLRPCCTWVPPIDAILPNLILHKPPRQQLSKHHFCTVPLFRHCSPSPRAAPWAALPGLQLQPRAASVWYPQLYLLQATSTAASGAPPCPHVEMHSMQCPWAAESCCSVSGASLILLPHPQGTQSCFSHTACCSLPAAVEWQFFLS